MGRHLPPPLLQDPSLCVWRCVPKARGPCRTLAPPNSTRNPSVVSIAATLAKASPACCRRRQRFRDGWRHSPASRCVPVGAAARRQIAGWAPPVEEGGQKPLGPDLGRMTPPEVASSHWRFPEGWSAGTGGRGGEALQAQLSARAGLPRPWEADTPRSPLSSAWEREGCERGERSCGFL